MRFKGPCCDRMLEDDFIEIAGVKDAAEAKLLRHCGVRYLGFPLRLAVHPEDLTEKEAAGIIQTLKPPTFGARSSPISTDGDVIADFCNYLGTRRSFSFMATSTKASWKNLKPSARSTVIKASWLVFTQTRRSSP